MILWRLVTKSPEVMRKAETVENEKREMSMTNPIQNPQWRIRTCNRFSLGSKFLGNNALLSKVTKNTKKFEGTA
jgi:hypothetical protein